MTIYKFNLAPILCTADLLLLTLYFIEAQVTLIYRKGATGSAGGGTTEMSRLRFIVPHCNIDGPSIDYFECSECEWRYAIEQPRPYRLIYEDAERACRAFDGHHCHNFNARRKTEQRHKTRMGTTVVLARCVYDSRQSGRRRKNRQLPMDNAAG